ncbi:MAG: hypothetical protein PVH18_03450 [Chloroflexota bacterium]|jgi:hypothetical protein
MIRKTTLLIGIIMLLVLPAAALAGGWVVITLDALPGQFHAGEPGQLSFMVRQHGKTPIHSVEPMLTATNTDTGERIQVKAEPAKELGRFIATVDFPSAGTWEWSISAPPFPQSTTFAPITVQAAPGSAAAQSSGQTIPAIQTVLMWSGLVLLAGAMLLLVLNRRRQEEVAAPVSGD